MNHQTECERRIVEYYQRVPTDMGAVRSAYSDAAHFCDAFAKDFIEQNRSGKRKPRHAIIVFAQMIEKLGDELFAMRDKIKAQGLMNVNPSPFEQWALDNGYDITRAVSPCEIRQYADRATQAAYDAFRFGQQSVAAHGDGIHAGESGADGEAAADGAKLIAYAPLAQPEA